MFKSTTQSCPTGCQALLSFLINNNDENIFGQIFCVELVKIQNPVLDAETEKRRFLLCHLLVMIEDSF